jgi:GR25 family glycosyltransferase involved in LPS biosynthesis
MPLSELAEIHLINLDRSTGRLAAFRERNAHVKNVVRSPAVDGLAADRAQLVKDGTIEADLPYPPGTLGCALSHIGMWRKAVAENRTLTVFEDDAVCTLNFAEETARVLSLLPADWEFIKWGCNFDPAFVWLDFGYVKANLRFYDRRFQDEHDAFQREALAPMPIRMMHSFGNQAYTVTPSGARKLLETCVPLRDRHITFPGAGVVTRAVTIDVTMCDAFPTMKAYLCLPPLVIQDRSIPSERLARNT